MSSEVFPDNHGTTGTTGQTLNAWAPSRPGERNTPGQSGQHHPICPDCPGAISLAGHEKLAEMKGLPRCPVRPVTVGTQLLSAWFRANT